MANQIYLEVVTPEKAVLSEQVNAVVVPGSAGQMEILPGHRALLATLDMGEMIIRTQGSTRHFFVDRGYTEVHDDKVTVLTEGCDGASEIDVELARQALAESEKEVKKLEERSKAETIEEEIFQMHRDALRRARLRLAFAQEGTK